jgi:hypothetical protein
MLNRPSVPPGSVRFKLVTLLLVTGQCLVGPGLAAQSLLDSIRTPQGWCRVFAPLPGGSDPSDRGFNRCALDSGPTLLTRDVFPPQPWFETRAGGRLAITVEEDGRVNPALTRFLSRTADTVFNRRFLETVLEWRFDPGRLDGEAVRSGFLLHVTSDPRPDSLPATMTWSYVQGLNEDTLSGTWVSLDPLPPYSTHELERIYLFLLHKLRHMKVLVPPARYCLVLTNPDSSLEATLQSGVGSWGLEDLLIIKVGGDCLLEPRTRRLVLPGIHRMQNDRAVLEPWGDYLPDWPPGFEGRTYLSWKGRCVADVTEDRPISVDCAIEPWSGGFPRDHNPLRRPRSLADPIRLAIVAMTAGASQADTIFGAVDSVPLLRERSVIDTGKVWCQSRGMWEAFTSEESGGGYLVLARLPADRSPFPQPLVLEARARNAPEDFPGIRCPPEDQRGDGSLAAFHLGDLGHAPSRPITLCVDEPGCLRRYEVDPDRHTLVDHAHLLFIPDELRPGTRAGGDLRFRIYTDRDMRNVLPLVLYRFRERWYAEFARPIGLREWEFPAPISFWAPEFRSLYSPGSPIRVYLLRTG